MCLSPRRVSYYLLFSLLTACTPVVGQPHSPASPKTKQAVRRAQTEPVIAEPPSRLPEGWFLACDAFELAADTYSGYTGLGYYLGREDEEFLGYDAVTPSDTIDLERTIRESVARIPAENDPPTCSLAVDLDGDHADDTLVPILHPADMRPGFLVQWGDGRPPSTVGTDPFGHVSPATGFPVCATSMANLFDGSLRTIDDLARVPAPIAGRGDAIALSDGQWLLFDGKRAEFLNPQPDFGGTAYPRNETWAQSPPAPACTKARHIRRRSYANENRKRVMWYPEREVARDACELKLDLDGDGVSEQVRWVEVGEKTGLRIDGSDGRAALLGAGNRVPIEALDGEPGCNEAPESFNQVWNLEVAPWDGTSWKLPDGRDHRPTHPELVQGAALAMTNAEGHVDLVFLSAGVWRKSAVPFEWNRYFVFWPAMEQWNWVQKPPPAGQRYHRPRPAHRAWIRKHTPGPPPDDVGRFYPGK